MNPWVNLPNRAPFVLDDDKSYIDAFNGIEKNERKRINTNHVPEARLGPISAPVVILQLNPSYDTKCPEGPKDKSEIEKDLITIQDEYLPHKGGFKITKWWNNRLKELRDEIGEETLSKNIMSVEFFPYRSLNFSHSELRIPSQNYSFNLVRNSIKRNAIILVGRGWKLWCSAIPELFEEYNKTNNKSVFVLKNPQCSYYSRNNLGDSVYDEVLKKIKNA